MQLIRLVLVFRESDDRSMCYCNVLLWL